MVAVTYPGKGKDVHTARKAKRNRPLPWLLKSSAVLVAKCMADADDGLRRAGYELLAANKSGLADACEELLSGLVLPAIAYRKSEFLGHIVELHLSVELHVRREIRDQVQSQRVDVQK